jgi:hypothetical protein
MAWLTAGMAGGVIVAFALCGARASNQTQSIFLEARVARCRGGGWCPKIRDTANPVAAGPAALTAAREHWADHRKLPRNDGSGDTSPVGACIRSDMRTERTQSPPTANCSRDRTGHSLTAMPGWSTGTADGQQESWHLA